MLSVSWWIGGFGVSDKKRMHLLSQVQHLYGDNIELERKAEQLQKERDQYRMAAEAEAKRGDELAARVERLTLERDVYILNNHNDSPVCVVTDGAAIVCVAWPESTVTRPVKMPTAIHHVAPTASILLHDADLLATWGVRFFHEAYPNYEDKFGEGHYLAMTNMSRMLHEKANELRKQAEQESKS
jgi:hypothetical protein